MTHHEAIHAYYRCYKDRDLETLRCLLTTDLIHRSPFATYTDRDQMLADIWPHVGPTWAVDIEVYGDGPDYMVRYRHEGESDARMAEYIRFDGDRIAEIEVYAGIGALPI